jgi:hypothetical protein
MFVRRSIAGIVLLLGSSIAPAQADSTASVTFSGYVAPACMVMTIDDDRLLPHGAKPQRVSENSILLRSNPRKSPLTPLKKGGNGSKVPLFKGDLGGSNHWKRSNSTSQTPSQDYLLLRCNTGAPDRLIPRDDRSSVNTTSARELRTADAVTIVP